MKIKLPYSSYNWISLIGTTIALITLFMIIFLFVITTVFEQGHSYLGLIIFIVLPGILVMGLLMIPLGMFIKARQDKDKHLGLSKEWPVFDMNDLRHRNGFAIFSIGTAIFLLLSAIGSYEAFHFTESVEFCGTLCHTVMKPEYVAYQNSPHARVRCVDCHVGEGADWYVRSKMSGMYQVYSVLANVYPTPIETPISNLRPARETCEKCHWPEKFYSHKLRLERHYLSDEENTEWNIGLIMKIGAPHSALGLQEGIHWHINPNVKIEYKAEDHKRESIPWVKYTNLETGEETIYQDQDNLLAESKLDSLETRLFDCMDCHTRPSHSYQPPAFFVNQAMVSGSIPTSLPDIKSISMDICNEEFTSTDTAMAYIRDEINNYYEDYDVDQDIVEQAIAGLQDAYGKNIFPEMKVRWDAYPNHIGHMEFDGCFRCHNDNHMSENETVISKDCNLCHIINTQGTPDSMMISAVGDPLEFIHPVDIDEAWKDGLCTDCHTGLNP